jgi:hypothetical protein
MSFSQFRDISTVAQQFMVRVEKSTFMRSAERSLLPNEPFRQRLAFVLRENLHRPSEAARCETLIYPMLYEVWQHFSKTLKLWSHTPIECDNVLTGIPDYFIASRSKYGVVVIGKPFLVAIEAKLDDFDLGWGQCAAEMVAFARLNAQDSTVPESIAIYGIVTNGEIWQFGKLESNVLTQEIAYFGVGDLDALFGALTFVMEECQTQVVAEDFIAA